MNAVRVLVVFSLIAAMSLFAAGFALSDESKPTGSALYTGLVVDARGLEISRSISPRIVNEAAAILWDHSIRDSAIYDNLTLYGHCPKLSDKELDYIMEYGICSYGKELTDAGIRARCGSNPLVVKAVHRMGYADDWVSVSEEDAKAIEAADKAAGFRKAFKVAILQ